MPGIVDPMRDILNKIKSKDVTNPDGSIVTPYVRVWNGQLDLDENGQMESFPKPAFFLETLSPTQYAQIGQGYRSSDPIFRVHIIHEYYDAQDGNMEQDLAVFLIRDSTIALLCYFNPAGCGPLTAIAEEQDYKHKNLYHLIADFQCNFTDSKGSRLDDGRNYYAQTTPPTALEVDVTKEQGNILFNQPFVIPK